MRQISGVFLYSFVVVFFFQPIPYPIEEGKTQNNIKNLKTEMYGEW